MEKGTRKTRLVFGWINRKTMTETFTLANAINEASDETLATISIFPKGKKAVETLSTMRVAIQGVFRLVKVF